MSEATEPGANATLAEPSALVTVPPALEVTRPDPGGDGPLPGIEAGSGGGGVTPAGVVVVVPDAELEVMLEPEPVVGGGWVPPLVAAAPASEPLSGEEPV